MHPTPAMSDNRTSTPSGGWRQLWELAKQGERALYAKAPAMLLIFCVWGVILTGDVVVGYRSTQALHDHGRTATATAVQLLITDNGCRSARCLAGVRARVPGYDDWVRVRDVEQTQPIPDDEPTGWQPATVDTGYTAPLTVLVLDLPGSRVDAMVKADVDSQRDPTRLLQLGIGVAILLAVLTVAAVWARRLRTDLPAWLRRTRRRQRPSPHPTTNQDR
ncbi:hypothetical protein [Phycicoccus ginsengisoli]